MTRHLLCMICAALIALAISAPAVAARPLRIALTKIAGDSDGIAAALTEAFVDSEVALVSPKRVNRAIDRLGLSEKLRDHDVEQLAVELDADAVIRGSYDRKAKKLRLSIFANGKKGEPFTIKVSAPRSAKFRKQVRQTVIAKLRTVLPSDDNVAEKPSKPKEAEPAKPVEVATTETKPAAKEVAVEANPYDGADGEKPAPPAGRTASAEHDDGDAPGIAVRAELASPDERGANLVAMRLDVGGSLAARSLSFGATGSNAPKSYSNAAVPGARFAGEVYPLALGDPHSLLSGLGIAGDFDQTITLTLRTSNEMTVPLKTTERHYSVGLRYRLALGSTATSPTLTVGAGYGARTFVVNRNGLMSVASLNLPDVDYRMFDPGLALRLPLSRRFAITTEARTFLVTAAGPIQLPDQYGTTTLFGGTASAGLEIVVGDRIALRLAAEATQLNLSFRGNGELTNSRDGDPSTVEVKSATDRYLGGAATLAVMY